MSRTSRDEYRNGRLINGYDYKNQAWVKNGKYLRCSHPETMDCGCYGKIHEGEETLDYEVCDKEACDGCNDCEQENGGQELTDSSALRQKEG